jgi:hypothetical protein
MRYHMDGAYLQGKGGGWHGGGGGMLMPTHEYVHQMFQLYLVTSVIVPFNSTPLEHLQQHCRNFFPKAYL